MSADGWREGGGGNRTGGSNERCYILNSEFLATSGIAKVCSLSGGHSSHGKSESGSLQASTSSMSARARARAAAGHPSAARRPLKHGGKTIIFDASKSIEIREKAAALIQATFLGVHTRLAVRRLRRRRERAAAVISRVAQGWRARLIVRETRRWAEWERLKRQAKGRIQNRAAHLITMFFHDIVYRNRRVRNGILVPCNGEIFFMC